MKCNRVLLIVLSVLLVSASAMAQEVISRKPQGGPPPLGIHWAKGVKAAAPTHGRSPLMLWHNGPIMTSSAVQVIYWGTSWGNSSFVGDKITGLTSWYTGFSGSNYAKTSDEYTGTNGQVGPTNTLGSDVIDLSPAGSGAKTSTILAEVCRQNRRPRGQRILPGLRGFAAWTCRLLRLSQLGKLRLDSRAVRVFLEFGR